ARRSLCHGCRQLCSHPGRRADLFGDHHHHLGARSRRIARSSCAHRATVSFRGGRLRNCAVRLALAGALFRGATENVMTIRSTLLAGTAVFAFGAAAAPVFAQSPAQPLIQVAQAAPPALVNAIAAYRDAQAALAAAENAGEGVEAAQAQLAEIEGELATLCEAIGQPDIQACIDLFGTAAAAPAEDRTEPEPEP